MYMTHYYFMTLTYVIHSIDNRFLHIGEAPEPDNINWHNMDLTTKGMILRRGLSLLLTLLLWVLSTTNTLYL